MHRSKILFIQEGVLKFTQKINFFNVQNKANSPSFSKFYRKMVGVAELSHTHSWKFATSYILIVSWYKEPDHKYTFGIKFFNVKYVGQGFGQFKPHLQLPPHSQIKDIFFS